MSPKPEFRFYFAVGYKLEIRKDVENRILPKELSNFMSCGLTINWIKVESDR